MLRPRVLLGTPAQCAVTSMAVAVVDYECGMSPGPTMEDFCIDAASGSDSKWNARSSQIFANDFCAAGYPEAAGKSLADVLSEFRTLLPAISADLAVAAGFEDLQSYRRFSRSFERRLRAGRKAESRLRAAGMLNDPLTFVPIVRKLVEEDSMSCDERDADGYICATPPSWRSVSATRWLRSLDRSPPFPHDSVSRKASVEEIKERVGPWHVPRSLPVNFYNLIYLHSLDRVQYADLDPQPAVDI